MVLQLLDLQLRVLFLMFLYAPRGVCGSSEPMEQCVVLSAFSQVVAGKKFSLIVCQDRQDVRRTLLVNQPVKVGDVLVAQPCPLEGRSCFATVDPQEMLNETSKN